MSELKIEKGVAIPLKKGGSGSKSKYPFAEMAIGDSFLYPCKPDDAFRISRNILSAASIVKPLLFITRREPDGIRVWRIE